METRLSSAVNEAFVCLHEKGLVYQGKHMVNWDPRMKMAVSDEMEYGKEEGIPQNKLHMLDNQTVICTSMNMPM